jgi:hypothetical protein
VTKRFKGQAPGQAPAAPAGSGLIERQQELGAGGGKIEVRLHFLRPAKRTAERPHQG